MMNNGYLDVPTYYEKNECFEARTRDRELLALTHRR